MNIPTAHSTESLERFLDYIIDAPIPRQVTVPYLRRLGFRSGNDPELRHILKLLGFLNDNFVPSDRWKLYKMNAKSVLHTAVEECYKELFVMFPDAAFARTDTELQGWFRPPITGDSKTSVVRAIRTFKKLCLMTDLTSENRVRDDYEDEDIRISSVLPHQNITDKATLSSRQPFILLPLSQDQSDYERIFEALKKVFYE